LRDLRQRERIAEMFGEVSPFYDLLNRLLSLGLDRGWRRRALDELRVSGPGVLLDVASGTGDVAVEAQRASAGLRVVCVDVSATMLARGRRKVRDPARCRFVVARAQALPFRDRLFDAAVCAFGVRNFSPLVPSLREMGRVVRPGGRVVILELTRPQALLLRLAHAAYLKSVVPGLGGLFGRLQAYRYLAASIFAFPAAPDFLRLMEEAEVRNCRRVALSGGIATLFVGEAGTAEKGARA
jgi:demethylmenaquinone methyltransferase/2-methoxy-6-polyprenyl-1,4-benzoquinol methylase